MNVIFIDFVDNNKLDKKDRIKLKMFKYLIKYDLLNNELSKKICIFIDKEYFNIQLNKNKFSIYDNILKLLIKKNLKKEDSVYLIFSKMIDLNLEIKEYILNLLRLNSITLYQEVAIENKLKEKDILYIDGYIKDNLINLNMLKILVIFDNINDYDNNKLLEYISKYKIVDVLITKNVNNYDYRKIQKCVQSINNEYGSTIDIKRRRNIQSYNIYLNYSDISKLDFAQKYILASKCLYINLKDIDFDIFSDNFKCYERYKPEILTLLKRMNINGCNFSKQKLGFIFK